MIFSYIAENFLDDEENTVENLKIDIHLEGSEHVHTGLTNEHHRQRKKDGKIVIAIGGGITSLKQTSSDFLNIEEKFDIFNTFLPSFCKTIIANSTSFSFQFYWAYDINDQFFTNINHLNQYNRVFKNVVLKLCPKDIDFDVHLIQCTHWGKPTWAQNDAMLEAYLDNVDFHYRVNDDTNFVSSNWTNTFISVLRRYDPSLVGVVGPNHSGGNTGILTYDFVHSTHIDIFGFYYPKLFTDWYGDNWMTAVYEQNRTTKVSSIHLAHTCRLGRRYNLSDKFTHKLYDSRLVRDRIGLKYYLSRIRDNSIKSTSKSAKLVVMAMDGNDADIIWGVIRNAQLIPVHLPGWRLRVYTPIILNANSPPSSSSTANKNFVPQRIISKLIGLGVDIHQIPKPSFKLAEFWPLAALDEGHLTHILIRSPRFRISNRESLAVSEWLNSSYALHCIRDHQTHADRPIPSNLWGVNLSKARELLNERSLFKLATQYSKNEDFKYKWKASSSSRETILLTKNSSFLEDVVYRVLQTDMLCHDTVSKCNRWPHPIKRIKAQRFQKDFIGLTYDSRQDPQYSNSKSTTFYYNANETCHNYLYNSTISIKPRKR